MKISRIRTLVNDLRTKEHIFGAPNPWKDFVPQAAADALLDVYRSRLEKTKPLRQDETLAVTLSVPKTAALCFDRVWDMWGGTEIESVGFGWNHDDEVLFTTMLHFGYLKGAAGQEPRGLSDEQRDSLFSQFVKAISSIYRSELGLNAIPIYASRSQRDVEFQEGDYTVVVASLSHLQIVDESKLDWQQVVEFRRDTQARRKYRHLTHWLDKSMVGKSHQFVEDEIASRLEDYEWALQKHGIKTVLGSLSQAINPKSLVGASAVGASATVATGEPTLALLTAGSLVIGKAVVELAGMLLQRRDIQHAHKDISFVYEAKQLARGRRVPSISYANLWPNKSMEHDQ